MPNLAIINIVFAIITITFFIGSLMLMNISRVGITKEVINNLRKIAKTFAWISVTSALGYFATLLFLLFT